MSQTKEGAIKAKATMLKKYGKDYWANIGREGGKNGTGHKYGHGKVDPAENGRKGGLNKRGSKHTKAA